MVVVLALVVGALRWINSWDYPPFLLMGIAAVVIAERAGEGRFTWPMAGRAGLKSVALVALSLIFFAPFQAHYELPATGFHQMEERETTPLHQYMAQFGVFLFLIAGFAGFLCYRLWRRMRPAGFLGTLGLLFVGLLIAGTIVSGMAGWAFDKSPLPFTLSGVTAGGFLRDTFAAILAPLPGATPIDGSRDLRGAEHTTPVVAFALIGLALLALLGWASLRRARGEGAIRLFVLGMLAMALLLSIAVEFATLDGDIQRMNTVFKFYLHIWILLGLAAAFGAWYLLDVVRPRLAEVRLAVAALPLRQRLSNALAPAYALVAAGFLLAALIYPIVATPQRVQDRFDTEGAIRPRTDDGFAYMLGAEYGDQGEDIQFRDDYAAIQWLRENVQGSPVIIEAVTPLYRWGGRFSITTGLPAVLGWDWHQTQQRGMFVELIRERHDDVEQFYRTSNPLEAQRLLKKYNVRYVILGTVERAYFPGSGLDNIEAGLGGTLRRVFEYGETQIYEVAPDPALVSAE
jgi:uncharacterized membrane protein